MEIRNEKGGISVLRIKQRDPFMALVPPEKLTLMLDDPPPQPPGRKLEDIPLFMRKKMPMDCPDSSHLPHPDEAVTEVLEGTIEEIALRFKQQGNGHFAAREWWDARECYLEAIELGPSDKLSELLWLNIAAANLEMKYWPGVLHGAAEAITLNLKTYKAYYRAAHALIHYERYDEAIDCCKRVLAFDPSNEAVLALMDDPRLGGKASKAARTAAARLALEEVYKLNNLIILLSKSLEVKPDNFPRLVPVIPTDPAKADLFCNVAFKYAERNALDVFVSVTKDTVIGALLQPCIPGRPEDEYQWSWSSALEFDPNDKSKEHAQRVTSMLDLDVEMERKGKREHPVWDPTFQYRLPSVSIYLETYKRRTHKIPISCTLGGVFQCAAPEPSDELEGVCLEGGSVVLNVFRSGSKVEKLWLEGKGRKGFALAHPKYKKVDNKAMFRAGHLRTFILVSPRDHLEEASLAARSEMLKGPDARFSRE